MSWEITNCIVPLFSLLKLIILTQKELQNVLLYVYYLFIVIKCERFTIANGKIKPRYLKFNTKVNITCNDGYRLRGSSVVTCGANSSWIPALPTCEQGNTLLDSLYNNYTVRYYGFYLLLCVLVMPVQVTCPPPAVPNSSGQDRYKMEYEVGEHATISCQEGFELIGSSQVTCGADSQWQEIPECRFIGGNSANLRTIHFNSVANVWNVKNSGMCMWELNLNCPPGKCQPPPNFPNAHTEHGNQRHYEPDTVVHFKCNHGYRMVRGPSTIYCRNSQWTDLEMICESMWIFFLFSLFL